MQVIPMQTRSYLDHLQRIDKKHLWHPYTQMKDYAERDFLCIERAQGIFLYDHGGTPFYDTISSWWCIVHGHGHPLIREAIHKQLDKLEQVLFAGVTHEPAILLAEKLIGLLPSPLTRVFYSDNGSTACEVALKMSLQYWKLAGQSAKTKFLSLDHGYHGDTIGTMSLGGVPGFHSTFQELFFSSYRVPSPYCYRCPMGQSKDHCNLECADPLRDLLREKKSEIAALIVEPLIQAAGGMITYPAAYLQKISLLAKEERVHLIFDEVATGFGRTGKMFALEHVGVVPDFLCLSKGLTAGFLPMAATITTEDIFAAFYDDYNNNKTFFHGHTFTANPLAASAALGSLAVFEQEKRLQQLAPVINYFHKKMTAFLELPWVGDLRQLGMIAAMELVEDKGSKKPFAVEKRLGWKIYLRGLEQGLILRPLGNIIYLWLPLCVTATDLDDICAKTWGILSEIPTLKK